jgi:uncharacterized protein YndB with AHSA1/START domain
MISEGKSMEERSVTHSTFVIEREYPCTPERAFAAFAEPDKKRRWYAAGAHHDLEEFTMDFRVGGRETTRSRFKEGTPFPGVAMVSECVYQDIVPSRRVVIAQSMSVGERRISAALITFEFLPMEDRTELVLTHQGAFFEGSDGPERREEGWRKILERLGKEFAS